MDFSPPERADLLVFLLLPGGTHAMSRPPSNGFLLFSNLSFPEPDGCRISYTLLKLLFTCSNTVMNRVFLSFSSCSEMLTRWSLLALSVLPSSISADILSAVSSYWSIASMFTLPRLPRRRSSPCIALSASAIVGS